MEGYNGWENHTTWLTAMWLKDTFYYDVAEMQKEMNEENKENLIEQLADKLDSFVEALIEESGLKYGLLKDILVANVHDCNYQEIAQDWLDIKQ